MLVKNGSLSFESSVNGVLYTTSTLSLCSVDEFDIGTYTCLATNSVGNDSVEIEIQVNTGESLLSLIDSIKHLYQSVTFPIMASCIINCQEDLGHYETIVFNELYSTTAISPTQSCMASFLFSWSNSSLRMVIIIVTCSMKRGHLGFFINIELLYSMGG